MNAIQVPTKTTPIWEARKWRIAGAGTQNLRHGVKFGGAGVAQGCAGRRRGGARLRRAAQGWRKAAPGSADTTES